MEGFSNPRRAERELATLEATLGPLAAHTVLARAREQADPDAHLAAFERCAAALLPCAQPPARLGLLSLLFEASELWPRLFAARPGLVGWLFGSRTLEREKSRETALAEVL